MTDQKPKRGASNYRIIASFLDGWLQCFPTDKSPLSKQKIQSEQQKFWFASLASSLSIRISHQCGPEASAQKRQWKEICNLQEQYEHEQNPDRAANLLIEIKEQVEQLRDSFVRIHNRHYGPTEMTKFEKALALKQQHPDWDDKDVAKEAGFAHPNSLYDKAGIYKKVSKMLKDSAIRKALPTIIRGVKNKETGEIDIR